MTPWLLQIAGRLYSIVKVCNSDACRLLDPTEDTFNNFVDLLDSSQGDILREASESVLPLLMALSCGTLWFQQPFPLETVDPGRILGLAKGSPSLIHLVQCGENLLPM